MIRFGEVCPKMMRALASKLPPPNYATFYFFETCQTLLNEISNLLFWPQYAEHFPCKLGESSKSFETLKRKFDSSKRFGFSSLGDAFDMMLGNHVQTKKVEDIGGVMLEDRTQFITFWITVFKRIEVDPSI